MTMTNNYHSFDVRVYMEDVDAMGCIYHPNYLKFCERARTEMFRESGFCHAAMIKEKQNFFVMRHMAIDYILPCFLRDQLTVKTTISAIGGASLTMHHDIVREQTLVTQLKAQLVCVDSHFKALKISEDWRQIFNRFVINSKESIDV